MNDKYYRSKLLEHEQGISAGDGLHRERIHYRRGVDSKMAKLATQVKRRNLPDSNDDTKSASKLKRTLTTFQLMMIGIGTSIGTGILFILSETVPLAGPGVVVSFLAAGLLAMLTVVCYAELASMIPGSGSAYSYVYATLGEGLAFLIGACIVLEYGVAASAVAVGWGQYLNLLLENLFGWSFPSALSAAPSAGGIVNIPAILLVVLCTLLLIRGTQESALVNTIMVIIKVGVLAIFIAVAATGFTADHFANFAPMGAKGMFLAVGPIFFSFVGIEVIATAGAEAKDPQRSVPRALVGAVSIVTTVYVLVALFAVGAQQWTDFEGQGASLSAILQNLTHSSVASTIMAIGAVISVFTVTLSCMYGMTRILYSMSSDGMIPPVFSRVHPRTRVPVANTIMVGVVVAALAAFVTLGALADLVIISTLAVFATVGVTVIVMRRMEPNLPRDFRVPGYPVTPIAAVVVSVAVFLGMNRTALGAFGLWLVLAALGYLLYGRHHSRQEAAAASHEISA